MKASLRSIRIAPKKAQLVAKMVRNMSVLDALDSLERTNKKAARILEELLKSAVANAKANDNQSPDALKIMSLTVNKAQSYRRGVPMARGRVRPMRKFLSHINLTLGIDSAIEPTTTKPTKKAVTSKKTSQSASQTSKTSVKSTGTTTKSTKSASAKTATKATKADTTSSNSDSARTKTAKKSSSTS